MSLKRISLLVHRWFLKLALRTARIWKIFMLFYSNLGSANNCFNRNDLWFSGRKTSFALSSLGNNLRQLENRDTRRSSFKYFTTSSLKTLDQTASL